MPGPGHSGCVYTGIGGGAIPTEIPIATDTAGAALGIQSRKIVKIPKISKADFNIFFVDLRLPSWRSGCAVCESVRLCMRRMGKSFVNFLPATTEESDRSNSRSVFMICPRVIRIYSDSDIIYITAGITPLDPPGQKAILLPSAIFSVSNCAAAG